LQSAELLFLAVGRALLATPDWPRIVREGAWERLKPFPKDILTTLY
jgi:hypothetical protein